MMKSASNASAFHERLVSSDALVKLSSDRTFGLVFFGFLALVGIAPRFHGGHLRWWALGFSGVFLILAIASPKVLHPLNLLWARLAVLLHMVVSPVAMGIVFFLAFTPTGVLMRALGKDPLRLNRDASAETYWIKKTPAGPPPDTMIRQF